MWGGWPHTMSARWCTLLIHFSPLAWGAVDLGWVCPFVID
jgi:hypothetical protein